MKYNIDEIVQRMDKERPRSNIRGVKPDYEAIARKWCKVMPWTAARLSDESGPETRL